ncbi:hypothetical protein NE237_022909 [Protea cynaroides]|uniref:Uncharacterized protein n=1 Tax=Protea cynaroides TaxID=273540 RepID=A0A9Q0HBW0_9MAGN|nr:hypothetical protein NE237_022909 [Protea cynaroides]
MYDYENLRAMKSKKEQEDEEEEEEALSLCDLPVVKITKDGKYESDDRAQELQKVKEDDFEFGSWRADSLLREPDMCAAEDVFFQGQILPLRLSVSSDCGIAGIRQDSRCASRSESMDHFNGFNSSRSSSIRSRNSNSSSSGSSVTRARDFDWNRFHAHPSPRPQIWQTSARTGNGGSRSRKSTVWGLFRLGLVRTPEIELQELKLKLLNRNKSNGSSNGSSNSRGEAKEPEKKLKTTLNRVKMFDGFSGCKCSVTAVETIPSRIATIKKLSGKGRELREEKEPDEEQQKQRKQAMAHRRTFEWLKQLSLADLPREG